MSLTNIEWTELTINPATGCDKYSPGCKNCYMFEQWPWLQRIGNPKYQHPSNQVVLYPEVWDAMLRMKKPRLIFVNSMSDQFHKDIPLWFIQRGFEVMAQTPQHFYQVLTKRSERLLELDPLLDWPENLIMGVSVENADYVYRIDHLRGTHARWKFLSIEPLLGPIPNLEAHLEGIHQVIVGGESGPNARPVSPDWVRDIRDQSLRAGVPFFFKQWGGKNKKAAGRVLDGRTWDEFPRNCPFFDRHKVTRSRRSRLTRDNVPTGA